MGLKKRGCLLQRTEPGQVNWVTGLFLLLFLGIFLCASLQIELFRSSAAYLEDALAASNLASAVIDVEEYGISRRLWIRDVEEAYARYLTAVRGNLGLNGAGECTNRSMISGPVRVVNYTVYNVSGNDVQVMQVDEAGAITEWQETLGAAAAPDGTLIESTGVYSEISYVIEGSFGVEAEAHKGKLVDIAAEEAARQ